MMQALQGFAITPGTVFSISVVLFTVLAVEAIYLVFANNNATKSQINRRMRATHKPDKNGMDVLVQLRKERGLDAEGALVMPLKRLNRLIVQADLKMGLGRVFVLYLVYLLLSTAIVLVLSRSFPMTAAALPITGFAVPLFWLRNRKARRLKRFEKQLPEAIDLITRSLKAGHPVPVALSMVGREMPDPVGTEFGMVVDEVTYGLDLVSALSLLQERVDLPDLRLLVSSVSIQSTTGGNLREVLDGLARVIRNRMKMKAKIKAISAEGRLSAIILTAIPVLLFVALMTLMPDYYGGIWGEPMTWYIFGGLGIWLAAGNLIIMHMVSFRI